MIKGTLNLKRVVNVKQYAPETFKKIRELHNITDEDLMKSLDPAENIGQIQKSGEGAGASGSFFFFAQDKNFIMKTMSIKEIHHLLRMIPSYYEHLEKYEASTIAKIFGMFTITMDRFEPIHVMIMQNVMPNVPNTDLHYVYDMKGSSINREVFKGVTKD